MIRAFDKPSFARTFALTILAIGALFAINVFLAKAESEANRVEAARFYENGQRLMQAGQSAEAADQFKSALSLERENQDYRLALGEALLAAGKIQDAQSTLQSLLDLNSFSGPANLAMARVLVKQDQIQRAISYYHRAIFGQWKENARANQVRARLELADLLSRQNSKEGLLAELLPLQDEVSDDIATLEKLGQWFLAADSPARAAATFRLVLRDDPESADAYAGLGAADFAQRNYRAARGNFAAALRLRPSDRAIAARLDVCDRVLTLDPTLKGLGVGEQSQRSRKLAELALNSLKQCAGLASTSSAAESIEAAEKQLKRRASASSDIELAERLWQKRKTDCGQTGAPDRALALVMEELAQ
ncbi:MAG TPA: tetratricopeptide repeat protein [Bryobacteraceae bacterium]|jgi:tetratricopeptide (TPR) repeat protein